MDTVVNVIVKTHGGGGLKKLNDETEKLNGLFRDAKGRLHEVDGKFAKMGASAQSAAEKVKSAGQSTKAFNLDIKKLVTEVILASGAVLGLAAAFDRIVAADEAAAALRSIGASSEELVPALTKVRHELNNNVSQSELMHSAFQVLQSGFKETADVTAILGAAAKAAKAKMAQMQPVAEALTSVMTSYGFKASDAGEITNKFFKVIKDGRTDITQYASVIGNLTPLAAQAGVTFEELNAGLAAATLVLPTTSQAATGLNNALRAIVAPTKEAKDLAEELGINFGEAALKTNGLGGVLAEVVEKTNGSTEALTTLFGTVDGVNAVLAIAKNDFEGFNRALKSQSDSTDAVNKAYQEMTDSIKGGLERIANSFAGMVSALSGSSSALVPLLDGISSAFTFIEEVVRENNAAIKEFIRIAISVGAAIGVFKAIAGAVALWTKATQALAAAKAVLMSLLNPVGIAQAIAAIGVGVTVYNQLGQQIEKASEEAAKNKAETEKGAEATKKLKEALEGLEKPAEEVTEETNKTAAALDRAKKHAQEFLEAQKGIADEAVKAAEMSEVIRKGNMSLLQAEFELKKTLLDIEKENAQQQLEKAKTTQAVKDAAEKLFAITIQQAKLDKAIAKSKIDTAVNELKLKHTLVNATIKQAQAERAVLAAKGANTAQADAAIRKTMQQAVELQKMVAYQEGIALLQKQQVDAIYNQTVKTAELTKEKQIQEGLDRLSKETNEAKTAELEKQTSVISGQNSELQKQIALQKQSLSIGQQSTTTVEGVARSSLPAEVNKAIIDSRTNFIGVRAATVETNRLREESRIAAEGMKVFEEQLRDTNRSFKEIMSSVERSVEGSTKWISDYAKEMYDKAKDTSSSIDNAATAINNTATAANTTARKIYRQAYVMTKEESKYFDQRYGKGESYVNRYASGGYVNTPTRAMIGEGGEGEYIVPESKMYEAMQRFGRGQRGESVVPSSASVNVNWNGEMIQMDGKAYIEKSQMPGLIQTAVTETMNTLHRNARARAFAGI